MKSILLRAGVTNLGNSVIYIVFNEKHREHIMLMTQEWHKRFTQLDNKVRFIYTRRGANDDAMALYLWFTNPGSVLFSNDNYWDWYNRLDNNLYNQGLWRNWISKYKIIR